MFYDSKHQQLHVQVNTKLQRLNSLLFPSLPMPASLVFSSLPSLQISLISSVLFHGDFQILEHCLAYRR